MRDELGGKIMRVCCIKKKTYSYLTGNNKEDKKAKETKKYVTERKLTFEDYKNYL